MQTAKAACLSWITGANCTLRTKLIRSLPLSVNAVEHIRSSLNMVLHLTSN